MKRIAVPLHPFPTDKQKIVIASPMYRVLPVSWFYSWLRLDLSHCVGLVGTEGVHLPVAMERMVETAFAKFPAFEWLVVMEDDVTPPADAFTRVASYSDAFDVVGSFHFMHEPPHRVMAWRYAQEIAGPGGMALSKDGVHRARVFDQVSEEDTRTWADNPGMHEVDAVAMGFTAIRRRVLKRWDRSVPMWQPLPPMVGQDLHFCHEARKQGWRVWVDSGLRCAHLSELAVDYSHTDAAQRISVPGLGPATPA